MKLNNKNKEKIIKKERTPVMILTIDIGNNKLELLNIYDINNPEQDIYNFCLKNKLDFNILKEINLQKISNKIKLIVFQKNHLK